jgi:hypothetical protein
MVPTTLRAGELREWRLSSKRSAWQQRDAAWARLDAIASELHGAEARIASLNEELPLADEVKA